MNTAAVNTNQAVPARSNGPAPSGSFPGPRVTGGCLVVAPLLAVASTVFGAPAYHARGIDFVAGMVDHRTGFVVGIQLALAAMLLLLLGVVGLAGLLSSRVPRWGRVAGVLTVLGLCGPISFESIYWAASRITDTAAHRAAAAVLIDASQVIPRTVMNVTGPCLVLGFVLLGIAAARAGVLDRVRAVLLGATCLIPFGFISGHLLISTAGFCACAVALVPLGASMLRGSPAGQPAVSR